MGLENLEMELTAPLNVISGLNEAGKSGIRDAIYWAFTGQARGLKTHAEQAALIRGYPNDMARAAEVEIAYTDGYLIRRKTPKSAATVSGEIPDLGLSPGILFDPYVFLSLNEGQRREMIFEVIPGINPNAAEIAVTLAERVDRLPASTLDKASLINDLSQIAAEEGFKEAETLAIAMRRDAKRDLGSAENDAQRPENWEHIGSEDYDLGMVEPIFVQEEIEEIRKVRDDLVKQKGRQEDAHETCMNRAREIQSMIGKERTALVMAPAADYVQLLKQDLETALQSLAELEQAGGPV
jgi:hypothetical protein